MSASVETVRAKFDAAGQSHVFKFWDKLSPTEQNDLLKQLSALDIDRVNRVFKKAIEAEKAGGGNESIGPPPADSFATIIASPDKEARWRSIGLEAIAKGQVGVLLMAGGQGTRLGSSAPKGCYDIGLPSHKSLFQYQAERIARLQVVAKNEVQTQSDVPVGAKPFVIPWYVMTSGPTRKDTEEFFRSNSYFGLDPNNVIFFEQGQNERSFAWTLNLTCTRYPPLPYIGGQSLSGVAFTRCCGTGRQRRPLRSPSIAPLEY